MNNNNHRYIISLGGSMIVPDEINVKFLKEFKQLIESRVKQKDKFLLITGGGRTARQYADAARVLGELNPGDLDWLGIHSTRLNGHLMRTIFRKVAHRRVVTNASQKEKATAPVVIAAGFRPGASTDRQAVLFAKNYRGKVVINLSNVDYVYDKDPRKHPDAKPIEEISWKDFRKIVGNKWDPGLHLPFDPVASRIAQELGLTVIVMNGHKLGNLKNYLEGKKFKGTIIS